MSTHERSGKSDRAAWFKRELRLGLVLFLYLWALLGLFVLNEDLVNRQKGDVFMFQGFALANALILAKVMLAGEQLNLARHFAAWPRIWVILFESLSCTLLFLLVHTLARVGIGIYRGESLSASMPSIGGGGLAGVLIVGVIFFVSLLPFFTFKHLAGAIGAERVYAILFKRPELLD